METGLCHKDDIAEFVNAVSSKHWNNPYKDWSTCALGTEFPGSHHCAALERISNVILPVNPFAPSCPLSSWSEAAGLDFLLDSSF